MFKIIAEPFTPPSAINPSISPAIENVVLTAMARETEQRYNSAGDMKQALEASSSGETVNFDTRMSNAPTLAASGPYTPPSLDAPVTPRKMETVAAAGAKASTIIVQKSSRVPLIVGVCVGVVAIIAAVAFVLLSKGGSTEPIPGEQVAPQPALQQPVELAPAATPAATAEQPVEPEASAEEKPGPVQATDDDPEVKVDAQADLKPSSKKKKKKKKSSASEKDEKSKKGDAVKGRFGTTFVGEYDD